MDLDIVSIISNLIEDVSDFKVFIKPFTLKGTHPLVGHSKAQ